MGKKMKPIYRKTNVIGARMVEKRGSRLSKEERDKRKRYQKEYLEVRPLVLERDKYSCTKCGATDALHVHHKIFKEHGGSNDMGNLMTLCKPCHAEKHEGCPYKWYLFTPPKED